MDLSIEDAERRLPELVQRALAGETVVLTRNGRRAVQLASLGIDTDRPPMTREQKERIIRDFAERASKKALPGPSAARSQDFLYDEDGLPG